MIEELQSYAEKMRNRAISNNETFRNVKDEIISEIEKEAKDGHFELTYYTHNLQDDVNRAIAEHLRSCGFRVDWELVRGCANEYRRVFHIYW